MATWLELGTTTVPLRLGGVASTNSRAARAPLVRPFWLLAGVVLTAVALFVWLRLKVL